MSIRTYFGVASPGQYMALDERRRYMGHRVAYSLLDVGEQPSAEQIRVFEDICFTLRLASGTFRTSFRNRFADVNAAVDGVLASRFEADTALSIQDRAVSHALTSAEWAGDLFRRFPQAHFEASDLLLHLVQLTEPDGGIYIAEPDGTILQAVREPFVVSVHHPEGRRFPLHRLVALRERRRIEKRNLPSGWADKDSQANLNTKTISLVHPEARALAASDSRFVVRKRSVFDIEAASCDVLRTMNILNWGYFSEEQLSSGVSAAWHSVRPGGVWVVGRTMEDDFRNNASLLRRNEDGWELLTRVGDGSELEALALAWSPGT
ncbi:MAG: hypothetical protein KIT83_12510 [Bryobacterales bacterium]|nr:hypothetical protein [Bryobacterales bacterium]